MTPTFEDFWALYPRKVAKGKARRAWAKQVKAGFSPQMIMDGLIRLYDYLMAFEPQFRPHPATWLNDERWEDEPATPRHLLPGMGTGAFGRRTSVDAARDLIARLHDYDGDEPSELFKPFRQIEH